MSTARFNTLENAAGTKSVPVATVVDGSAKAWVNFNGTGTVAIRASFNVTSITDSGVGSYSVNFTTAMADANYASAGSVTGSFGGSSMATTNVQTTFLTIATSYSGGNFDPAHVHIAIFR